MSEFIFQDSQTQKFISHTNVSFSPSISRTERASNEDSNEPTTSCNINTIVAVAWIFITFLTALTAVMLPYVMNKKLTDRLGSWINCLGAGFLLGTCFFHLLPELLEQFIMAQNGEAFNAISNACLFIITGFLFVLFCEQIATICFNQDDIPIHCHPPGEHHGMSHMTGENMNGHSHHGGSAESDSDDVVGDKNERKSLTKSVSRDKCRSDLEDPNLNHCHESVYHHSKIRALLLVFSISIHALFEGVALTMQAGSWTASFKLGVSLIPHKLAVGMTMGFQMKTSKLSSSTQIMSLLFWAIIAPAGSVVGLIACQTFDGVSWVNGVNGFALGTFIYILFFEIAPHEFLGIPNSKDKFNGLKKAAVLALGVLAIYAMGVAIPHSHSHGEAPSGFIVQDAVDKIPTVEGYLACLEAPSKGEIEHGHSHGGKTDEDKEECKQILAGVCEKEKFTSSDTGVYKLVDKTSEDKSKAILADICLVDVESKTETDQQIRTCFIKTVAGSFSQCMDDVNESVVEFNNGGDYIYDD